MRLGIWSATVAVALATCLTACGSDESTTTAPTSSDSTTEAVTPPAAAKQQSPQASEDKDRKALPDEPAAARNAEEKTTESAATELPPETDRDSGGGSAQFRTKGGDNSIQDFGQEVVSTEFEAAAAAFHGYMDAVAAKNWAAACSFMAKEFESKWAQYVSPDKAESDSCATILEAVEGPAADAALKADAEKANVYSLRADGDDGYLIYSGARQESPRLWFWGMKKESGQWKVADPSPISFLPGS